MSVTTVTAIPLQQGSATTILVAMLAVSVFLVVYSYALYPLVLRIGASLFRRSTHPTPGECPTVSLVIAAYNEETIIDAKIRNTLALDYPTDRLQVLIGSDGSSDRTDEICRSHPFITFERIDTRQGKANVLNTIIPKACGDIVILSDANTLIEPQAIKALVRHFSDASVGGVCGHLVLDSHHRTLEDVEQAYWRYESRIKELESQWYSTVGANGGIYAIRRELFEPIPADTIIDDFVISLHLLEHGKRLVFDADAVAHEDVSKSFGDLFWRKVRIGAGNLQTLQRRLRFFLRAPRFILFAYASRKVIRGLVPFLLILSWFCSLALVNRHPFGVAFWGLNASIALATLGLLKISRNRLVVALAYLYSLNAALLVGYGRYILGQQPAAWDRAPR